MDKEEKPKKGAKKAAPKLDGPEAMRAAKLDALSQALGKIEKSYGKGAVMKLGDEVIDCLLYTSPSPRDS